MTSTEFGYKVAIPQADIDGRKIDTTDQVQVAANLLEKLVASGL